MSFILSILYFELIILLIFVSFLFIFLFEDRYFCGVEFLTLKGKFKNFVSLCIVALVMVVKLFFINKIVSAGNRAFLGDHTLICCALSSPHWKYIWKYSFRAWLFDLLVGFTVNTRAGDTREGRREAWISHFFA